MVDLKQATLKATLETGSPQTVGRKIVGIEYVIDITAYDGDKDGREKALLAAKTAIEASDYADVRTAVIKKDSLTPFTIGLKPLGESMKVEIRVSGDGSDGDKRKARGMADAALDKICELTNATKVEKGAVR